MKPRLLQTVLAITVGLGATSLSADTDDWFGPTWSSTQRINSTNEIRSPGRRSPNAQVQFEEELPSQVPSAPAVDSKSSPITVAAENGFPTTMSPDDFKSQLGLHSNVLGDDEFYEKVADEVESVPAGPIDGAAVHSDGISIDTQMPIDSDIPVAPNMEMEIYEPQGADRPIFNTPILDGTILNGPPESEAPAESKSCNCEMCRLKRSGYKVIGVQTHEAPAVRRCFTKCVSPGHCAICEADNACPVSLPRDRPGGCEVGGWLPWGTYKNSHGLSGQQGNTPLGFNNIADQLQLHQAWLYAERPLQDEVVDWGYRMDFMFGSDGPNTQAFGDGGWDDTWDTSSQYGFAMPQLYLQGKLYDWNVKIGRFYTIIGYEVVQAPDNFFYSHAYTMVYNEPFTHTGFLFDRQLGENWTVYGGWTAGWDSSFSNNFGGSTFLGGMSYAPSDRMAFTYTTSFGDPGVDDLAANTEVIMQSLIFDFNWGRGWNYVFQADWQIRSSDAELTPGVFRGKQYGINQYFTKKINCRWSAGARMETFYAGEGFGPPLNSAAGTPGSHFNALTFGLNYRPSASVVIKPELRYDWVDFDGPAGGPFDEGQRRSQASIGLQTVWSW